MMDKIRIGLLTVSDRCFTGEYTDKSGDDLADFISKEWGLGVISIRKCVPDEIQEIKNILCIWSDDELADVILTTGGTGFSCRDVTPEATKSVIEKDAPGLVIAMMQGSLNITPMAMLSRPVCGVRRKTLIINLPGSSKGSMENFKLVQGQIKHAVDLMCNSQTNIVEQHNKMMSPQFQTKVDAVNVADRARKSPYKTIEVQIAQEIVMQECSSTRSTEVATLKTGLGSILVDDIFAKDPLPPFPAAIKDGYAVKVTSDIDLVSVMGDSTAGENPDKCQVNENFCVRVSTGAPVPAGADAVVQIEDTELVEKTSDGKDEKIIRILKTPISGQDIRPTGSDINVNEKVLIGGSNLGPVELGILAAVGVHQFAVYRKPVVALLSTGNELQNPDETLCRGKIRDSNKTTLEALFTKEGFRTVDIGVAKDTPQEVLNKLVEGLQKADVLVSTGGVSMGERDYLKRVLLTDLNAKIHFGSLLMKPGKPTTFATCNFNGLKKLIFGLPGNPVSATVTSHLFVIPACRKLCGWETPYYTTIKAKIDQTLKLDLTRPEYHRTTLTWMTDDGIPVARSTGNQISSRLKSCCAADALLVLPQGSANQQVLQVGTIVDAILISSS